MSDTDAIHLRRSSSNGSAARGGDVRRRLAARSTSRWAAGGTRWSLARRRVPRLRRRCDSRRRARRGRRALATRDLVVRGWCADLTRYSAARASVSISWSSRATCSAISSRRSRRPDARRRGVLRNLHRGAAAPRARADVARSPARSRANCASASTSFEVLFYEEVDGARGGRPDRGAPGQDATDASVRPRARRPSKAALRQRHRSRPLTAVRARRRDSPTRPTRRDRARARPPR